MRLTLGSMLGGAVLRKALLVSNRGGTGGTMPPWTYLISPRKLLVEWMAIYAAKCIGRTASGITSLSEKNITSAPL